MKTPIITGVIAALVWIAIKWGGYAFGFFNNGSVQPYVFTNMFLLTASVSIGLFLIKKNAKQKSNLLLDIKKSMDVSSVLFIQVPLENLRILFEDNLHVRKKHWHEHINFFSVKSLNHLLQNTGLHILNTKQIKVNHKGYSEPSFELLLACRITSD